jgi:aminoglycoside phosphotransferase (APT) family kinase protein
MPEHVRATPPPAHVPRVEDDRERLTDGWRRIASDPAPFLSLGVCSETWLEAALEALTRATEAAPIEGDALLHLDVRSDNVCIRDRSAVLVDWNQACVGNPLRRRAAQLSARVREPAGRVLRRPRGAAAARDRTVRPAPSARAAARGLALGGQAARRPRA